MGDYMNILKKYWFIISMTIAIACAIFVGIFASNNFVETIAPLGDIFVNLMFTLVVPLVFFTISSSIANMNKNCKLSKVLTRTFLIFVITSAISAVFMLIAVLILEPSNGINIDISGSEQEKVNIIEQIASALTVGDFSQLFSKSHMLALIVFSIIFGICLRIVDKEKKITQGLEVLSKALLKFVKIVMYYAPIGVFAYFASLIKSYGEDILSNYLKAFIIYIVISILYFILFYTLYAYIAKGKEGVKNFYKHILPSFTCSIATQSSLASLPTNLETAAEMHIDDNVSKVALPLGATVHMEGSAMGSILKIFFLFSVFNMPINGISTCIIAIIIAIASGVVMSGIPGGGLIGEMLIVSLYGFPPSAFTMIATIGWIIDAPATMLNVCGDIPSAMMIEKCVYKSKE